MISTDNSGEIQEPQPAQFSKDTSSKGSWKIILGIILALAILVLFIFGIRSLCGQSVEQTSHIRDIFIIIMALEALVVGAALVILIIQVAILTNLLQNEIKPIIESTAETANTLRGTAAFLSNNLVEPIIKLNEYIAGIQQVLRIVRPK